MLPNNLGHTVKTYSGSNRSNVFRQQRMIFDTVLILTKYSALGLIVRTLFTGFKRNISSQHLWERRSRPPGVLLLLVSVMQKPTLNHFLTIRTMLIGLFICSPLLLNRQARTTEISGRTNLQIHFVTSDLTRSNYCKNFSFMSFKTSPLHFYH